MGVTELWVSVDDASPYIGEWCSDERGTPAVFTSITSDMTVYAVYTKAYTVTMQTGTGYTLSAQTGSKSPAKEGGSFTVRFALANSYQNTADFAVKVNGVKVELAADGAYTIIDIRENQTVTAEGVAKKAGKPSGSGGDKEDGRNPGTASAAEKGPEGRLGAAPKQKENGKPEEKSGTDGMDAGTPETESTDAGAVVEAVLTPGQQEIVNSGRTIEIRIEVTDISEKTPAQDKEMIESGIEAHREEAPGLVLGMYVAISMFVRIGEEEWNVVTETKEPIEVVMGIPEKLLSEDRKFYIIRAHNGEYTFMDDLDSEPDTITIRTDLFSSYAIAYVDTEGADSGAKCSLCHICPALFGVCCFIWLAVILAVMVIVILVAWRRRKAEEPGERKS